MYVLYQRKARQWIQTVFVKLIVQSFVNLVSLFNRSMSEGFYLNILKVARIISVFKASDRQNPTNFRLISKLSSLSNIFEKILHKRIMGFLLITKQITEQQFVFQPKQSTIQALVTNDERIRRLIDSNMNVLGLFLDTSKVFDTVDHGILLTKLEQYDVRRVALLSLRIYIQKRKQYVQVRTMRSISTVTQMGVPQLMIQY